MGKIEVLSPIHIGSGVFYYSFNVIDDFRYPLEDLIETVSNPVSLLNDILLNKLIDEKRASQMSNQQFFALLGLNKLKIDKKKALYELDYYEIKNAKIYENIRENNKMIIPGSTLRGTIENLLIYDIISQNKVIRDYFIKKFNVLNYREIKKAIDDVINNVKNIFQLFGCRDIYIDNNPFLYECSREGFLVKKKKAVTHIPVGIVECINKGIEVDNCEIIFYPIPKDKNKSRYFSLKTELEKDRKLSNNQELKNICHIMIDEAYKRINNISGWIKEANKKLMFYSIEKQIMCLKRIEQDNKEVDARKIISFLNVIKQRINNGELIMRVGKFCDYITKSVGPSFNVQYDYLFKNVFTPNNQNKTTPTIDTINVLRDDEDINSIILGYMKVEL